MTHRLVLGLMLSLIGYGPALAQSTTFDPPVITVLSEDRIVRASAFNGDDPIPVEQEVVAEPTARIFRQGVDASNGGATASAGHETTINAFRLQGGASAAANSAGDDVGEGYSLFSISFTVPVDAEFGFSWTLQADASDGQSEAYGFFSAVDADGVLIGNSVLIRGEVEEETDSYLVAGTLLADSEIAIVLWARSRAGSDEPVTSFEFDFNLGDTDGDGLLDAWEEDGFDFDGDGIKEIDLAGHGADPLVKDIFVEIDVMQGIAFDDSGTILQALEAAFDNAPPALIDNPSPAGGGVNLHLNVDFAEVERPPNGHLTLLAGTEDLPAGFWAVRDAFFGSEADRNHPERDQIMAAREFIYRYALWADTFEVQVGGQMLVPYGVAEGIPSSNFLVASGNIENVPEYSGNQALIADAKAGTFMHELGHALGLFHGGQDALKFKPHYLSVMNDAHAMPIPAVSDEGTAVEEIWELDYSRSDAGLVLNETALVEIDGVQGGPAGRKMIFNSAPSGEVSSLNIEWVDASELDWNDSGGDMEETPYPRDLTRIATGTESPPAALIDDYDHSIVPHTDWDKLVYDHKGPAVPPTRGSGFIGASVEPCLDEASFAALANAPWNDHTALGFLFRDSFESVEAP